jgi:two-component system cell cycle sensor histidine kinase PleC
LTAQIFQPGRSGASEGGVQRRRSIAKDVRAVREKLTSSIGLERAFDYELIRLFAQQRLGAALPLFTLACAIAAASALWTPLAETWFRFVIVLAAMAMMLTLSRWFLGQDPEKVQLPSWRRRFILGELLQSVSWASVIQVLVVAEAPGARSFVLFILLMLAAIIAMLSAPIPIAVYVGLAPLVLAVAQMLLASHELDTVMLVIMAASAQVFFIVLANRLYCGAVANLQARAEKDALFAELEEAKANSDEARRRAEGANLAKSRFLATMSHELRTPLNAILGFSEVMKNEVFGPHSSASYQEYSEDIHGSGQHLLNLINEILDLSRIEAGRYELNPEAVQLAYIVEDCRHMLNLRAKAKNQTIRDAVDPSLPRVWVDERAVRQVVLNILSNAVKFTPQGGEIEVKVGWTSSGGQYVSVKDSGPGIPRMRSRS